MKRVVISKDNVTTLKVGLTDEELKQITAKGFLEFEFDKYHGYSYKILIKRLKDVKGT